MIKNNPDVEPLIIAATEWEHVMVYTQDVLDLWLRVQTNYLFLSQSSTLVESRMK